jgi:poly(beta-D-mannuronate) lyase
MSSGVFSAQDDQRLPKIFPAVPGYVPIYSDRGPGGSFSEIDPSSYEEMKKIMAGFWADLRDFIRFSDRTARDGDGKSAARAVAYLRHWAEGGHMLTEPKGSPQEKNQSRYEMKWSLQGIATAYALVIKPYVSDEDRAVIEPWLKAAAKKVAAYNIERPGDGKLNNHYYWGGASVMAVAVATGDEELMGKAEKTYKAGIDEIQDDGTLPREMKRKQQSLHYHNYALTPLVFMAELSKIAGKNWYAYRPDRLNLLQNFTLRALDDSSFAEKAFGVKQDDRLMTACSDDHGWMYFYPDRKRVEKYLPKSGRCSSRVLGGDIAMLRDKGFFSPKK